MTVLDASALLELLLNTQRGWQVARAIKDSETALCAPHLIDLEVVQVLRRFALRDELADGVARGILNRFSMIKLIRYPHSPLMERVWSLRHNLTAYDAAYLALAELLDARLLTCDRKMAKVAGDSIECLAL